MRHVSYNRSGRVGSLLVLLSVLLLALAGVVYLAQPARAQTQQGEGLVIVKEAYPADDTPFRFLCTPNGVPDEVTSDLYVGSDFAPGCDFTLMDPSHPVQVLGFGSFYITEVLPPGWELVDITCDGGVNSSPRAFPGNDQVQALYAEVWAGTTICTFHNQGPNPRPGRIHVDKVVSSADAPAATFEFDASWGEQFMLGDGESHASGALAAGAYAVTENLPAGFELESVACATVPGAVADYEATGSGVMVELAEGQVVFCTFTNRYQEEHGPEGSLTIIKRTVPAGGTGFEFDGGALGTFSLDDGGIETFTGLAAGEYVVTETPAADWEFASVECDALDWEADGPSVTVNLGEGEAAVCTFSNGELPYTGLSVWLPLLLGGLTALLAGLGLWARSWMREAEKA